MGIVSARANIELVPVAVMDIRQMRVTMRHRPMRMGVGVRFGTFRPVVFVHVMIVVKVPVTVRHVFMRMFVPMLLG